MNDLIRHASEIRCLSLQMIHAAGSGHPGGCLSVADILDCLYFHELRVDPQNPDWPDRDRFVLSKGHSCPALYAVLAMRGFFDMEELYKLRKTSALLQGHPDIGIPGIDAPSTEQSGHVMNCSKTQFQPDQLYGLSLCEA